jgi:pyrimidine-nucleoside phosphorylase
MEVIMSLGAEMLAMAGLPNDMEKHLANGNGLKKFMQMVVAQGGEANFKLPVSKYKKAIVAPKGGFVHSIECDQLGYAVIALGGGRKLATDQIDYSVGFENPKKIGDQVKKGDPLIIMHYNDERLAQEAEKMVL